MSFEIQRWVPTPNDKDGLKAIVWCPDCDLRIGIRKYEIAADGELTPSLVCPHDGCTFHEFVRLRAFAKLGKCIAGK